MASRNKAKACKSLKPSLVISLRLPVQTHARLRELAATERRSVNWLISDILREQLALLDARGRKCSAAPPLTSEP
jgi:hypothetical protein